MAATFMPPKTLAHIKRVTARGNVYYYFRTGRYVKNARGAKVEVLTRLPDIRDKRFANSYAAAQAARTKREPVEFLTLTKMIDQYQRSADYAKLAASSKLLYDVYFRELDRLAGQAPADDFTDDDVRMIVARMGERKAAANAMVRLIGSLYSWAITHKLVGRDCRPIDGIKQYETGEHMPWPVDVLEAALNSDVPKVKLSAHLLFYTGQRIGDVMRMRWADIQDGRISVVQQKTGKALSIPLHRSLAALLDTLPRHGETILCRHDGEAMTGQTVRIALKKHCASMGVSLVPHGLRRNAVNALLEAECSVAQVAAITGQSLRMVEYYARHRNQVKLSDDAMAKWNEA